MALLTDHIVIRVHPVFRDEQRLGTRVSLEKVRCYDHSRHLKSGTCLALLLSGEGRGEGGGGDGWRKWGEVKLRVCRGKVG